MKEKLNKLQTRKLAHILNWHIGMLKNISSNTKAEIEEIEDIQDILRKRENE